MSNRVVLVALAATVLTAAGPAMADYYDRFEDGMFDDPNYWSVPGDANSVMVRPAPPWYPAQWPDANNYDPNVCWDIDDPHWQIWSLLTPQGAFRVRVDPNQNNALHLWADHFFAPTVFIGAMVNSPPYASYLYPNMSQDPNVIESDTFFTKDTSHYAITYATWNDPNKGEGIIGMHVNPATWQLMALGINQDPGNDPYIYMHCGPDGGLTWYGPGMRKAVDLAAGVWMAFEFDADGDANFPNAPAGVPLWKSAVWNGDKYDDFPGWELVTRADSGAPLVYQNFGSSWDPNNPANYQFHEEGIMIFAYYATKAANKPVEGWFDEVEVRTGEFGGPCLLDLMVTNPNYGKVVINPELPDPNDPNTSSNRLLRYTCGTDVVLVAEPISGKSFNRWTIYDPNYPDDANYGTFDSNTVLYLTMNEDIKVEAAFKCGTGLPPFVGMMLLALGLGVLVRRVF
ncbi:MAG: hypothetical protein JXQ73_26660 [Phycisphaerae bacterium]|nr:hypothetical protein [Phycisphaerae bacterium]